MGAVLFRSTNGQSPAVNLREALLGGQAPDRGLYLPEQFPRLAADEIASFARLPYHEIAFRVLSPYTGGILDNDALAALCRDAYRFAVPLEKVYDRVHVMRLDQGPTASFKDFAARMMARLIGRFLREDGKQLTILTATSGDTGSAVAHAFHNVPGIRVLDQPAFTEAAAVAADRSGLSTTALLAAIDQEIAAMRADGTLTSISKRRFGGIDVTTVP